MQMKWKLKSNYQLFEPSIESTKAFVFPESEFPRDRFNIQLSIVPDKNGGYRYYGVAEPLPTPPGQPKDRFDDVESVTVKGTIKP